MSLTPEQIAIVKSTAPILAEHGLQITTTFYKNILAAHTGLNEIFSQSNQLNGQQPRALAAAVYAYAAHIDNLSALSKAVELICQKHASLHVKPAHYPIVGQFLIEALKQVLGDAFTIEIESAWAAAYYQLANLLIAREKELYDESAQVGWTDWREFVVDKRVKESEEVTSFYLKPKDGGSLPGYKPGSYISIRTKVPQFDFLQPRQYSLSDAPGNPYFRISVKRDPGLKSDDPDAPAKYPGWVSNVLHDTVKEGDILQVSHPRGDFFLDLPVPALDDQEQNPIVLISAGVGLTPLTSIINTLAQQKSSRPISWIHAARNTSVQPFAKHIHSLMDELPNAHEVVFIKAPGSDAEKGVDYHFEGRMDLEKLDREKDLFLANLKTEYFICGPSSFMSDIVKKLQTWGGVDDARIHYEIFGAGVIGI